MVRDLRLSLSLGVTLSRWAYSSLLIFQTLLTCSSFSIPELDDLDMASDGMDDDFLRRGSNVLDGLWDLRKLVTADEAKEYRSNLAALTGLPTDEWTTDVRAAADRMKTRLEYYDRVLGGEMA